MASSAAALVSPATHVPAFRPVPCSICGRSKLMMCLFEDFDGKELTIHPRCGKDPTHDLHILSTAKVYQRFGRGSGCDHLQSGRYRGPQGAFGCHTG